MDIVPNKLSLSYRHKVVTPRARRERERERRRRRRRFY